jgi:hypothetical protein
MRKLLAGLALAAMACVSGAAEAGQIWTFTGTAPLVTDDGFDFPLDAEAEAIWGPGPITFSATFDFDFATAWHHYTASTASMNVNGASYSFTDFTPGASEGWAKLDFYNDTPDELGIQGWRQVWDPATATTTLFSIYALYDLGEAFGANDQSTPAVPSDEYLADHIIWYDVFAVVQRNGLSGSAKYSSTDAPVHSGSLPGYVIPLPEPATWAMMIAGFGLVGATMRRRYPAIA